MARMTGLKLNEFLEVASSRASDGEGVVENPVARGLFLGDKLLA